MKSEMYQDLKVVMLLSEVSKDIHQKLLARDTETDINDAVSEAHRLLFFAWRRLQEELEA